MTNNLLIKDGTVISPGSAGTPQSGFEKKMDVRISNGVITECGDSLSGSAGEQIIDARGLWVLPGFIDLHTHLRDLGQSDSEDIESGTRAAACGGYTTVVAMANTQPPVDNRFVLSHLLKSIEQKAVIEVLPVACVTKGINGIELTNMVELTEFGAAAFSDDGLPVSDLGVLRRALEYAKLVNTTIISHPEDKSLSSGGVINESVTSVRLGLPGIPNASESACIAREIEVVRETGGRLHFAHLSTAASVELVRRAKAAALPITADVTPHHLALTDEDIHDYNTSFKMNPPLRSAHDRKALIQALKSGVIDAIATDHAPHMELDKSKPFDQAPWGIIGLETAFPLILETLASEISLVDLVALFSTKPAAVLGRKESSISKGHVANLSLFDPKLKWTYDAKSGFSKSSNSPFTGRTFTGKNLLTLFKGKVVYEDKAQVEKRIEVHAVSLKN